MGSEALASDYGSERYELGSILKHAGWFPLATEVRVYRFGYAGRDVRTSFVIPVYNQAELIRNHLEAIAKRASTDHEFVVLIDGCTDRSLDLVVEWAKTNTYSGHTVGVSVVEIGSGIFETLCDSVGIVLASGDYVIEVQADMLIRESCFDEWLISALTNHAELVVVGGRGAHSFEEAGLPGRSRFKKSAIIESAITRFSRLTGYYRPTAAELHCSSTIGRTGTRIDLPHPVYPAKLFVHETTMRGPWAVRRSDFLSLGGFDVQNFFLGNDDHDFALRAALEGGRRVGYLPIRFDSPLEWGSTRSGRTSEAAARLSEIRRYYEARLGASVLGSARPVPINLSRYILEQERPSTAGIGTGESEL